MCKQMFFNSAVQAVVVHVVFNRGQNKWLKWFYTQTVIVGHLACVP